MNTEASTRVLYEGDPRERAAKLLRLGITGGKRPIDRVIARLAGPAGRAWLDDVLSHPALEFAGITPDQLASAGADLRALRSLKDRAKQTAAEAREEQPRDVAVLLYFLAVAAAMASRPADDLVDVLVDLAEPLPDPWKAMLLEAARVACEPSRS